MTRSASRAAAVGAPSVPGHADGAEVERMIEAQAAFAGHGFRPRECPCASTKLRERLGGVAVNHAATGHDQRAPAPARIHSAARSQRRGVGPIPAAWTRRVSRRTRPDSHTPPSGHPAGRASVTAPVSAGTGQHAHDFRQRGEELIGAVEAIPVAADGLEAIVDRDVLGLRRTRVAAAPGRRCAGQRCRRAGAGPAGG